MAPLPSKTQLLELKRSDLQKLCKDYGVKANLKTDALIELLLDTKKANPRTAAPAPVRSVSTRHVSRSAPRISSVIIHDTDEEDEDENEQEIDEEETENQPEPQPEPEPIPMSSRTRKAKDTQTRLGRGRPVAAGGNGPRAVTVSVAKPKRGKNSKAVKPVEDPIPEEAEEEQPSEGESRSVLTRPAPDLALSGQTGPSALAVAEPTTSAPVPAAQEASTSTSAGTTAFDAAVAEALRPVYQQLESLKSELEQLPVLKTELAQLREQVADMQTLEQKVASLTAQVDSLTAQSVTATSLKDVNMVAASSRPAPNPSTPRFQSPAPRPVVNENAAGNASSSNSKTISPMKNYDLPNPGIAPSMLGKRQRESTSSNITGVIDEGEEGDLDEEELAKRVVRPTKKRPKLQQDETMEDFEIEQQSDAAGAPRVPSFTVFSGEEEEPYVDPPPPTEGLPDFYRAPSPTGSGTRQGATTTTTSTQNASENQHPFTFAFLPISSTPAHANYNLPPFPYPEPPQSPSPAGPSHSGPSRNHGERTDIFGAFGLPPPGRPRSRVTSTSAGSAASRDPAAGSMDAFVDPAALTRRASDQEREEFDFMRPPSASDNDGDASGLKRTMYGTELDGDTRFGDFGLEGVASGFWAAGGRF
ncbi:hypothetical protein B0H16DRAFT_1876468 [Mycena metata]|uniref:Uncharacterized protein n=1 Tax=Mycena metata TaxID=1033252 RepID=A0AAD7KIR2_9AGAR|nr:hypothetical protein B0H16DRAFT_1876468 [Mycena metata]